MRFLLPVVVVVALLLSAFWVTTRSNAASTATDESLQSGASADEPFVCPVTTPPATAFVPPEPWPSEPPGEDEFWHGTAALWTALSSDGIWENEWRGIKFWFWSEHFDVTVEERPALTVSARRLDGEAPPFEGHPATNGYHESINWAMLTGVDLSSPGCWEVTAAYKDAELSFVVEAVGEPPDFSK